MDSISGEVLENIYGFDWTLTSDGDDYSAGNNGCGNPDASSTVVNNGWSMGKKTGKKCAVRVKNLSHIFPNQKIIEKQELEIGK